MTLRALDFIFNFEPSRCTYKIVRTFYARILGRFFNNVRSNFLLSNLMIL